MHESAQALEELAAGVTQNEACFLDIKWSDPQRFDNQLFGLFSGRPRALPHPGPQVGGPPPRAYGGVCLDAVRVQENLSN